MGLFEFFRRKKSVLSIADLIQQPYEQKYLEECRKIWQTWVPPRGQSTVLQGELLRACEKLRHEAQDNGNINWDDHDFPYLCSFLKEQLCHLDIFSEEEQLRLALAINHLLTCGRYAFRFNEGEIPDDAVQPELIAYLDDNLYDIIADAVGQFYLTHPEPIPHEHNPDLHI